MKRILIISAIVLLVTAPIAMAGFHGQRSNDGPGRFEGRGMQQGNTLAHATEIGLNDEQVQKIKDLSYAHHAAMIDLKAQLEKARLEMRHEMQSDNPGKEKALVLTRQINDIEGKMAEARTMHRFDVRGLLNAEQLGKLKACQGPGMDKSGMGPMQGRGGRGGQDGQGRGGMQKRDGSCGR